MTIAVLTFIYRAEGALHATQLLLDVNKPIDHRLDGLLVQFHLHAFDS